MEFDVAGRGLKAQMKYADKLGARYVIVVGDNELAEKQGKLKDMESGTEEPIALDDSLYTTCIKIARSPAGRYGRPLR